MIDPTQAADDTASAFFEQARPVWLAGRHDRWNQMAGFYARCAVDDPNSPSLLRITGADAYRVWMNGSFVGYGPARTALGYARVDEWPLNAFLREGANDVAIEVHSHGIDSYVYVLQPPFLQAELVCGTEVMAATPGGFTAQPLLSRVEKVERYSKQRPFAEAYRLEPGCNAWRVGRAAGQPVDCEQVTDLQLLPRHVLLPTFDCVRPTAVVAHGDVVAKATPVAPVATLGRRAVGKRVRLLEEVRGIFGPQAAETGTLWEHATSHSSCNHGFASCACVYVCDTNVDDKG